MININWGKLTPEQLECIVKTEPRKALMYAAKLLTPEQFERAVRAEPWAALKYAAELLTPEQKKHLRSLL